jgi:hypothetical protein
MAVSGFAGARDRNAKQRWTLNRRERQRARGDICSTCRSLAVGVQKRLLTRVSGYLSHCHERNTRGHVRTCTGPNLGEGLCRHGGTAHGYMPAPAIRLDDAARSLAAQIYIRGTLQLPLPGIWKQGLQPQQDIFIAYTLNMTACHAAHTGFRDAATPHRTICVCACYAMSDAAFLPRCQP